MRVIPFQEMYTSIRSRLLYFISFVVYFPRLFEGCIGYKGLKLLAGRKCEIDKRKAQRFSRIVK